MNAIIAEINKEQLKPRKPFKVGDSVRVHQTIREGDKERVQIFVGMVISIKGAGIQQSFTVRRMSFGVGVEKNFKVNSPNIVDIEVEKESVVMKRSRLYYIRDRKSAGLKVKEKRLFKK